MSTFKHNGFSPSGHERKRSKSSKSPKSSKSSKQGPPPKRVFVDPMLLSSSSSQDMATRTGRKSETTQPSLIELPKLPKLPKLSEFSELDPQAVARFMSDPLFDPNLMNSLLQNDPSCFVSNQSGQSKAQIIRYIADTMINRYKHTILTNLDPEEWKAPELLALPAWVNYDWNRLQQLGFELSPKQQDELKGILTNAQKHVLSTMQMFLGKPFVPTFWSAFLTAEPKPLNDDPSRFSVLQFLQMLQILTRNQLCILSTLEAPN